MLQRSKDCNEKSDEEIVKLALVESAYYLYLMKRYEKKLMRYIIRLSGLGQEDAEDILQEVFIKVYKNLNDFDATFSFSSWIYRITRNETISDFRKRSARPATVCVEDNDFLLEKISADDDMLENIDRASAGEIVRDAISRLDEKYRDVLILRFIEDKNYHEMADILEKPEGTIATLINRAKERLKKEMQSQREQEIIAYMFRHNYD
ncbi:MAG: sigma-70 family RNA polymerase sigma factor [bacterium]